MKKTVVLKTLVYISLISEAFPLIFCIIFFKKIVTKALKVFFVYAIFQAIFSLLCYISALVYESATAYLFILRIHLIIEYILISLFLYYVLRSSTVKKIVLLLIFPYLIYSIYDYFLYGNSDFVNYTTIVEFLIFIIFIIYFLFEKMQYSFQIPVYNSVNFWISVGIFVYVTGSFFYFLLVINSKTAGIEFNKQLLIINSIVTVLKNIILGLALIKNEDDRISKIENLNFPIDLSLDNFTYNQTQNQK